MNKSGSTDDMSGVQQAGLFVFIFLCGVPAMELNGFGFGLPITFQTGLFCATLGGLIGGVMVCHKPLFAGIIGGLLAGPAGLLAVYYYTQNRQQVWNVELALVQGLASVPGFLIGKFLTRFGAPSLAPDASDSDVIAE